MQYADNMSAAKSRAYIPVKWEHSIQSMLKDAESKGFTKYAACDLNEKSGAKGWASFASAHHLFEYIQNITEKNRNFYELVTESRPVCLWFDIEFLCEQEDEGEKRRVFLDGIFREALLHSFGLKDPQIVWGTSTRFVGDKKVYKHSYQLRVRFFL